MFSKYFKNKKDFYIDNLDDIPENTFINDLVKQQAKNIDETIFKFLKSNGYSISKPYDFKQLEELREQLAKEDKVVDTLEYTEYDFNNNTAIFCCYPFFNRISNPLTEKQRQDIINYLKRKK